MFGDKIIYALNNLRVRKLRTGLTMLGIAIAVATVTALVSLGLGLQVGINEQFEELGGNKVFIQGKGFGSDTSGVAGLVRDDAKIVERVPGVEKAYGMLFEGVQLEYKDQKEFRFAFSIPTNEYYTFTKEAWLIEARDGRFLRKGDQKKLMLGYSYGVDDKIFDEGVRVRDSVLVNGVKFEVVGIAEELGNPEDDANIYIIEDDLRELFDEPEKISMVFAQVTDPNDMDRIVETITRRLRTHLGQEEGEESFFVQSADQFIESFNNVLSIMVGFIIAVGFISLVVGAINITNTMYTAVIERTQEIGTIKAIGGKNVDIQTIFLIESAIIGVVGGLFGTIIGYTIAFLASQVVAAVGFSVLAFYFPAWLWTLGIGFAVLMSIVSGYLPSRQASKLKPVEALRYE